MKKIESLCKEIEDIKKNQVEILELKKCNNQNKKLSGYSQLQNEGNKELVNWEIKNNRNYSSGQHRENRLKGN